MNKRFFVFMVIGIVVIFCHFLSARRQVARIVGGEKGGTVLRMVNGTLETLNAKYEMPLYHGDIIRKPGGIDSVQIEFRPYAQKERRDKNSLLIVSKTPEKKEGLFTTFKKMFGLMEVGFYEVSGASRGLTDDVCLPGENATVFPGQRISFQNCRYGETIIFKDLMGKEIFRKTMGEKDVLLTPREIGMVPTSTCTWEIVDGKQVRYRSIIKQLSKEDGDLVKIDLKKIDHEKIDTNHRRVKKAAYLQFISDLYPGSVNLYWLSYRLLKEVKTKDEKILDMVEILKSRCLIYFNRGISELDFDILASPGCLLAVEWEKGNEKKYVSPDFAFHEEETIWFHLQTDFDGYAVILYEDRGGSQLVFPVDESGYQIKQKNDRNSLPCIFDDKAADESFIFILSKKPIEEMAGRKRLNMLNKRAQKEGRQLKVEFIGTKAFVTTSEKELEGLTWFRLVLKNRGKE